MGSNSRYIYAQNRPMETILHSGLSASIPTTCTRDPRVQGNVLRGGVPAMHSRKNHWIPSQACLYPRCHSRFQPVVLAQMYLYIPHH